jgi:hypothetical protein
LLASREVRFFSVLPNFAISDDKIPSGCHANGYADFDETCAGASRPFALWPTTCLIAIAWVCADASSAPPRRPGNSTGKAR